MIVNPDKVKIETQKDLVDLVTKGLPPTQKTYDKVLQGLEPSGDDAEGGLLSCVSEEEFRELLDQMYKNNRRNTTAWAAAVGGMAVLAAVFGIRYHETKQSLERLEDKLADPAFRDCGN